MPLASRLSFQFEQRVQSKGYGLYNGRRVQVMEESASHLTAIVIGTQPYDVSATYADGRLRVSCECPYFADFGQCKHIWAAVLEADRRGALSDALHSRYLKLEDGNDLDLELLNTFPEFRTLLRTPPQPLTQVPAWQDHLTLIRREAAQRRKPSTPWPKEFEVLYIIDLAASKASGAMVVELFSRAKKRNGEWSTLKPFRVTPAQTESLPDTADVEAISAMLGGQDYFPYGYYSSSASAMRKSLPASLAMRLIPQIAETGRLWLRSDSAGKDLQAAAWDPGEPWKLWLEVRQGEQEKWSIEGSLRRGVERMPVGQPQLLLEYGLLVNAGTIARFDAAGAFAWASQLRSLKRIPFRDRERDAVLEKLLECEVVPPLDLDDALKFEERRVEPRFGLRVTQPRHADREDLFHAHFLIDYGRGWMEDAATSAGVWVPEERVYLVRDAQAEEAARETLQSLGLKQVDRVMADADESRCRA